MKSQMNEPSPPDVMGTMYFDIHKDKLENMGFWKQQLVV